MREVYDRDDIDYRIADEEIDLLKTQYFKSKISKTIYSLPSHPRTDDEDSEIWFRGSYTAEWLLTNKGLVEAHNLLLKDKKERRESISFWMSILFGLLGLIIGLVSVIKN